MLSAHFDLLPLLRRRRNGGGSCRFEFPHLLFEVVLLILELDQTREPLEDYPERILLKHFTRSLVLCAV